MEEKNSIKISFGNFILILIIIVLLIAVLGYYIMKQNKEIEGFKNQVKGLSDQISNTQVENTQTEDNNKKFISEFQKALSDKDKLDEEIDSKYGKGIAKLYDVVSENGYLYDTMNKFSIYDVKTSFHMDKKVEYKDLSNVRKLLSIMNCSEQRPFTFPQDEEIIKELLYKENVLDYSTYINKEPLHEDYDCAIIYSNIKETADNIFEDISDISFDDIDNGSGCAFTFSDDKYYKHGYQGGGAGVLDYGYSEIQKVEKDDNNIYIYDKYVCIDFLQFLVSFDASDGNVHIYSSSDMTKEVGKLENIDEFGDELISLETFKAIYDKYENNLTTYKHTFKKTANGENYYWVSSEPIK